jgi:hypothetical protein
MRCTAWRDKNDLLHLRVIDGNSDVFRGIRYMTVYGGGAGSHPNGSEGYVEFVQMDKARLMRASNAISDQEQFLIWLGE